MLAMILVVILVFIIGFYILGKWIANDASRKGLPYTPKRQSLRSHDQATKSPTLSPPPFPPFPESNIGNEKG